MKIKSQSGVAHLQLLVLLLLVAGVVGFAGWKVMQNQNNQDSNSVSTTTTSKTSAPNTIKTNGDLNTAKTYLNQTNIDNDVNPDSLNADVNSLL